MLVGDPGSLSWTELMTRDTSKAQAFYRSLFGWDYASMPMGEVDYTMIKCGDKDAGGMMPMAGPQFEGVPAHWLVYLATDDCDAVADKVSRTGGTVIVQPTEIPVGKFSMMHDPQGGVFAVVSVTNPAG